MSAAWPSRDGQFLVVEQHSPQAPGAVRHELARYAVDVFSDLPVVPVHDKSSRLVGLLLGSPVHLDAGLLTPIWHVDQDVEAATAEAWVEHHIYQLAGSFIFILDIPGCARIYLDADGSKSLVYDPARRVAAATAMTMLDQDEYAARLQTGLHRRLGVGQAGWFPAGLTAHAGISRLICNHYLDLADWTQHRHWPLGPIAPCTDPATAFDDLLHRVRQVTGVLSRSDAVRVALTAGLDSRFILSALRPIARDLRLVTVAAPAGVLDVATARRIASMFGLSHQVLPCRRASQAEAQAWLIRAGHCVGGTNMYMHPSVYPLRGQYFLGGLGGEVGRGFLWLGADEQTPIDAAGIVARLKLPLEPVVIEAVARWLEPIAHWDTLLKLDLAYLELRMSSWAFADSYANPVQTELHPMISRANYAAMLSVPPAMRRDGAVFRTAILRHWPDLLALPLNRYGDWRDGRTRVLDAVANPGKVGRKLRQLLLTRQQAI